MSSWYCKSPRRVIKVLQFGGKLEWEILVQHSWYNLGVVLRTVFVELWNELRSSTQIVIIAFMKLALCITIWLLATASGPHLFLVNLLHLLFRRTPNLADFYLLVSAWRLLKSNNIASHLSPIQISSFTLCPCTDYFSFSKNIAAGEWVEAAKTLAESFC